MERAGLDRPAHYVVRVEGVLDRGWAAWFEGLTVTPGEHETTIAGPARSTGEGTPAAPPPGVQAAKRRLPAHAHPTATGWRAPRRAALPTERVDIMTDTTVDAEVRDLGARWAAAELAGDAGALRPLLTDDFVGVGPLGYMLTKQQWLDRYTSGDFANQQFRWDDIAVRSYGQAAIAVGVQTQQATDKGRPSNGRFRLTQVFVRTDSGWRNAGLHLSPLADQAAPSPA